MTDVFISYAREDRNEAAELARLLEEKGYTVWWDRNLVGGDQFRAVIGQKLKAAKKVIVLWSEHSTHSTFVMDEAQEASEASKLIPIVIDGSSPPLGFRNLHTLYVRKFAEISDVILAAIENTSPLHTIIRRRKSRNLFAYGLTSLVTALAIALITLRLNNARVEEPAYIPYSSQILGVTLVYPHNILSLDTTQRKQMKLFLRDGDGKEMVRITRRPLPDNRDVKKGRDEEVATLQAQNYSLTYIAPAKEKNWKNWYVLSGVKEGKEFYFRRWYSEDSVVSIEFNYTKELAPLFDKLIPKLTQELIFTSSIPKTDINE